MPKRTPGSREGGTLKTNATRDSGATEGAHREEAADKLTSGAARIGAAQIPPMAYNARAVGTRPPRRKNIFDVFGLPGSQAAFLFGWLMP